MSDPERESATNRVVNYDLPWNPMRLVRRHGRIGRIGSQHSEVFIHCVFSDARLDDLLGLAERLHRRLTRAAAGIGVGVGVGGVPARADLGAADDAFSFCG